MPLPDYSMLVEKIPAIQQLKLPQHFNVDISVLRLDQIHPNVSGNKLFKLIKFLDDTLMSRHKTILTFGGAFSNHLVATAFACRQLGLKSIGLIRGASNSELSNTLTSCVEYGMEIHFLSRFEFSKTSFAENNSALHQKFGDFTLLPAGGYGRRGAEGASEIMNFIPRNLYSHICVSVGSGATLSGLLFRNREEKICAFPAIKNMHDIPQRLEACGANETNRLSIFGDYHFGGFAKKNAALLQFMNDFFRYHAIPLDFVYTAKMMYGVIDLAQKKHFPAGSHLLCIHTGGLQGNGSLESGLLSF